MLLTTPESTNEMRAERDLGSTIHGTFRSKIFWVPLETPHGVFSSSPDWSRTDHLIKDGPCYAYRIRGA